MNRSLLFVAFFVSLSFQAKSQNYSLCQQVIAAAGKSGQMGNRYYSYTIGEPFITTLSSAGNKLTQGFHQPELCKLVSTQSLELEKWQIEVFPNPTQDFLNIRFAPRADERLYARVYDLLGRPILQQIILDQPDGTQLDCSNWQAGVYFLQLSTVNGSASAVHRFVRL